MISIKNLCKKFQNGNYGIKDVSFDIPKGQAVAILGRNGAGKSTLINIIASIIKKTSGTITIDGLDLDKDNIAIKRKIGVMTQDIYLDVFLTLEEYLRIYANYYGIQMKIEEIKQILDTVGLLENSQNKAREISGGMKRRFCLAKAMIHKPEILILDEPTAAVDVNLSKTILGHLQQVKNSGRNVLLTTHQFHEVEQLCDRIIVISNGEVSMDGSVKEILPKIQNGF